MNPTSPIRIQDILVLRDKLGIGSIDMAWLLGITANHWGTLMRDARLAPSALADPRHAVLVRWLAGHPQETPSLYGATAGEFLLRLRRATGSLTAKAFALALGWDASAGYRWHRRGAPIAPTGRRAISLLDADDDGVLAANWREWSHNADLEARLRGLDLARVTSWRKPGEAAA